jgi:hypothetical protein
MTSSSDVPYSELDSRLRSLIFSIGAAVHADEIAQVWELVDHAEYGLALSMLAELLVLDGVPVFAENHREIISLASLMGILADLPGNMRVDPAWLTPGERTGLQLVRLSFSRSLSHLLDPHSGEFAVVGQNGIVAYYVPGNPMGHFSGQGGALQ